MLFPLEFIGHTGRVDAVALHPDGTLLASGGEDKTIRIWDLQAPEQVKLVLRGHEGSIRSLAFSPTQNVLASGGADNTIRLWNLQFPDYPPLTLTGHTEEVLAVAFSLDGTMLASAGEDNSLRLWPLNNLRTDFVWLLQIYSTSIHLFEGEEPIASIAFSLDGTSLAIRSHRMIYVWDLDNLEAKPVILDEANSPLLSDTSSQDKGHQTAADTAAQPGMLPPLIHDGQPAQQGPIRQPLAFSPDGKVLASGHQNNSVTLWTRTEVLVEEVCQRVWRNLSLEEWSQFVGASIPYEATCPDFR
jgi:WD40 repeat protein